MKMSNEHYDQLSREVAAVIAGEPTPTMADWMQFYAGRDLTEKRARWDLLWSTSKSWRRGWFGEVYEYANDDHIDTALRRIIKESM